MHAPSTVFDRKTVARSEQPLPTSSDDPVHARRWWILGVLCLSLLIVGIDGTIVNVALPSFVRELGASTTQLQWISDAYTLAFASLLLTAGTLGDRFGRRGSLLWGLAVFGGGSLASSMAGSANVLIATRAIQGLGAAFVMPATLSILTNVFDESERGRAIGLWAGVSGLGVAIGPITGGWLLTHYRWGSIFMVNLPIVLIAIVGALVLVPNSKDPSPSRIDLVGTFLSIGMLVSLLYGMIEGPSTGWTSPTILSVFAIGVVLLSAFVRWELHTTHPTLDVTFFKNPRFSAASTSVTLVFFAMFGSMFFLTQYLQFVLGFSPLAAGVRLLPAAIALMIAAPVSSFLVARFGTKAVVTFGLATVAAALFLMSRATVSGGYGLVAVVLVVLGIGMGCAMAPATDSIMGSLPESKAGVGSAVNDTTREIGGALGVAVLGSLTASAYSSHLASSPAVANLAHYGAQGQTAATAIKGSIGSASIATGQLSKLEAAGQIATGTTKSLVALTNNAFVSAMSHTVVIGGVVALLGAVVAWLFLPARTGRAGVAESAGLDAEVQGAALDLGADVEVTQDRSRPAAANAVLRRLAEAGYSSLSFAGLATRSGIDTATLEHNWTSKVDVVVDAFRRIAATHAPPDTGSLASDCRAYTAEVAATISTPAARVVMAGLARAAQGDPDLGHQLRERVLVPRRTAVKQIVRRAVVRGEISGPVDEDLLIDALVGPIYHRVLVTKEPVDPTVTDRLVDLVLAGATPRLAAEPLRR
jgi:EmrB/QacA subfamily drug resistance transporter